MGPLDQALGFRVGRLADDAPWRPACRGTPGTPRSARRRPRRHRPIAPSPSQTSTRGTAPSAVDQLPPAGEQVLRRPGRDQHRATATASSRLTIVSTGSCVGRADLPEPDRQLDRRGTTNRTARSPRPHSPSARPGPAADTPAAARPTRSLSTVIARAASRSARRSRLVRYGRQLGPRPAAATFSQRSSSSGTTVRTPG